jgi:hypothetical protein
MIWVIIGIILTIIMVGIMKDTHVIMYNGMKISEEHDIEIPLWVLCVLLLIELIPLINIIAFIGFVVWYVIMYNSTPQQWLIKHTFKLQGKTYVGRAVLAIINFLNIKV